MEEKMAIEFNHRKTIFIILVITIVLVIVYLPGLSKFHELISKKKDLDSKIRHLTQANEGLSRETVSLKTDPVYLEKVARDKMKIAKPDEIIYKVQPQETEENRKAGR